MWEITIASCHLDIWVTYSDMLGLGCTCIIGFIHIMGFCIAFGVFVDNLVTI